MRVLKEGMERMHCVVYGMSGKLLSLIEHGDCAES